MATIGPGCISVAVETTTSFACDFVSIMDVERLHALTEEDENEEDTENVFEASFEEVQPQEEEDEEECFLSDEGDMGISHLC